MGRTPPTGNPGELRWLAGLLEGEGHFRWDRKPIIQVQMTDRDVIERAGRAMGSPSIRPGYKSKRLRVDGSPRLASFCAGAYGTRAAELMMTLHGLMGIRRKNQIRMALAEWACRRSRYCGA